MLYISGFLGTMQSLRKLGLIDLTPHPALHPNGPEITWVINFNLLFCSALSSIQFAKDMLQKYLFSFFFYHLQNIKFITYCTR